MRDNLKQTRKITRFITDFNPYASILQEIVMGKKIFDGVTAGKKRIFERAK